jgi:hypothetical protein
MKTVFCNRRQNGNVLIMALVVSGILGFALASYLTLVRTQNRSVVRSQVWNSVIPLVEAGIEEALANLNQNGLSNLVSQPGWHFIESLAVKSNVLGSGRYVVSLTTNILPTIECTGYIPAPFAFSDSGSLMFAASGEYAVAADVQRTVRVTARAAAIFAKGMVARGGIDFNGNNVATDSFDSADPNFSVNGRYNSARRKDNGDVATNSKIPNMFNAGNANIMGKVATGPGGNVTIGANGTVGNLAWVVGGNTGIQTGYFSDDMNMSFPPVTVPFSGGYAPMAGTVSSTNWSFGTGMVSVATLPSPLPGGPITTNYGTITTTNYPATLPPGGVFSNYVLTTSTDYPNNPLGAVLTNTMTVITNGYPSFIHPTHISTNITIVTNTVLPSPAPSGTIQTNSSLASVRYPSSPMPAGPPASPPSWEPPSAGTYVGTITNRFLSTGANANRGWWHDYKAITSYTYYTRNYLFTIPISYTYTSLTYTYSVPQVYSYYAITTTNITVTSQSYDYVLDSYDYTIANLSVTVYVRGNARLLVTANIQFTGKDGITIGPRGSLQLYMSGANAKIAGNGVINQSGNAMNFMYYGLPSNTSLDITGNGQFTGAIYAPDASFTLRGGGNNAEDFIGASVTGNVTMVGHFNFHYDENLGRMGPKSRYKISSWNEIRLEDTQLYQATH